MRARFISSGNVADWRPLGARLAPHICVKYARASGRLAQYLFYIGDMMEVFRYVHSWGKSGSMLCFHTFPMFHVGTESFYTEISKMLNTMNAILEEGVPAKKRSEFGTYSLLAYKMGLVSQHQALKIDGNVEKINVDISWAKFNESMKKVSIAERIKTTISQYLVLRYPKEKLLETFKYLTKYTSESATILIDPFTHYSYKHSKSPFDYLILNQRDIEISENLERYIKNWGYKKVQYNVGIVFGDEHMPGIYMVLRENGFKWKLEKKLFIF
jgi:hypothetical protein